MKIRLSKDRASIAAERQRRYLEAWPMHKQMEAHAEAAQDRPAKLQQMTADFAAIKAALPYPPEE